MLGFAASYFYASRPMHGALARFAERWRLWRERRRWVGEIADAAALGRLDGMLDDLAVTRADLNVLMKGPADAGRQFVTLAEARHVDLCRIPPEALREASWKCIRCEIRAPCKRWLRTGTWDYDGDPRCPNAALLRN
jgi:hypothetical protein